MKLIGCTQKHYALVHSVFGKKMPRGCPRGLWFDFLVCVPSISTLLITLRARNMVHARGTVIVVEPSIDIDVAVGEYA